MSATPKKGVQEDARRTQDLNDRDNADAAKERLEFEKAPIKGFEDLPDDHPMAKRQAAMEAIEQANAQLGDGATEEEVQTQVADAIRVAADPEGISAFKDPPSGDRVPPAKPAAKAPAKADDSAAQAAAQTGDPIVLDAADLAKYQVRVKVDGKEELQPAEKVFRQFQKGAAADVRLAEAGAVVKNAQAEAARILREAQENATNVNTATGKPAPTAEVAQAAQEKFEAASEQMYLGNAKEAAALFAEAVGLAQGSAGAGRSDAIPEADLVKRVTENVLQQQSQNGALEKLFNDYPEIKTKKAFALIADDYKNAFLANGDDYVTAVFKAGEAVGEEYGLGKWRNAPEPEVKDSGRLVSSSGPTTRAAKLSAKDELDNITSGNARATTTEAREPSIAEQLDEMRKGRPGQALT